MRSFLWAGTDLVQGDKCAIAWSAVQRPLTLGGLGIPDFKLLGMALRLRWLWRQRCDRSQSWATVATREDKAMKALFEASITCVVGDGSSTLFWTDPWLDGQRRTC
jgi:hypothetical protein